MPKLAPVKKPDTTTATGQAVARGQRIAAKKGAIATDRARPADSEPSSGADEFAEETTSNPQSAIDEAKAKKAAEVEAAFAGALSQEELDALPGGASEPAVDDPIEGPPAKKAVAKRPAKKAAAKKAAPAKPVASTDDFFAPLEETSEFINLLFYGRDGSGKTTDAATAAQYGRVLVINAEGGLKISALKKRGIKTENIMIYPNPKSDEELDEGSLERVFIRVQADLIDDPKSWFAVVMDSGTEVGQKLTDAAQEARVARQQKTAGRGVEIDKNFVDRDDYGVSAKIMRKWLRRFRDLPCHFIVTALERRDVDEDTGKVQYGPAMSPAVVNDLMGLVDIAIMVKAPDEQRAYYRGATKNAGKYRTKDRYDILPAILVEPTFDRVLDYFTGLETEENDAFQTYITSTPAKMSDKVAKEDAGTE